MAVTGLLFAAFVFAHMVGNLKAWMGPEDLNSYAYWLRHAFTPLLPAEGLLWILRSVLLLALLAHVVASFMLRIRAGTARGPYKTDLGATAFPARSMLVTGVLLLAFVVFHLLDLTTGHLGAGGYRATTESRSYAYENLVLSMSRPWAGAVYLVLMLALGLHLLHGVRASANDLGVTGGRTRRTWLAAARILAAGVVLGNAALPVGVWTGVLS